MSGPSSGARVRKHIVLPAYTRPRKGKKPCPNPPFSSSSAPPRRRQTASRSSHRSAPATPLATLPTRPPPSPQSSSPLRSSPTSVFDWGDPRSGDPSGFESIYTVGY
ncbi:unnamed protein product [Urochloa humidicola]